MKFQTSDDISENVVKEQAERLRSAGFLPNGEKLEIVIDPKFLSVEEWADLADDAEKPAGDETVCWIAYQAALGLCGGDAVCKALAFAAYQACLNS
jgi:hypothetical protein